MEFLVIGITIIAIVIIVGLLMMKRNQEQKTDKKIQRNIRRLASGSYSVRQKSISILATIGESAVDPLAEVLKNQWNSRVPLMLLGL